MTKQEEDLPNPDEELVGPRAGRVLDDLGFVIPGDEKVTNTIIGQAAKLLSMLENGELGDFDIGDTERFALTEIVMAPKAPRLVDVEESYSILSKTRSLTERPVPALVCVPYLSKLRPSKAKDYAKSFSVIQADELRARVLLVCIRLTQRGFQPHISLNAARTARHLIDGRHSKLLKALPAFGFPMDSLVRKLTRVLEETPESRTRNRIYNLQYAFKKYRPKSVKEGSRGGGRRKYQPEPVDMPLVFAPEDCEVSEIVDVDGDVRSIAQAEYQHDQSKTSRDFRIKLVDSGSYRRELALSASRAGKALVAISMREAVAPCSSALLTDHVVTSMLKFCYPLAICGCPGGVLIAVSLFWGRPVSALIDMPWIKGRVQRSRISECVVIRRGRPFLWHRLDLPSHGSAKYAALIERENEPLLLPLPDSLGKAFCRLRESSAQSFASLAKKHIKTLSAGFPISLTEHRIGNHMYVRLIHDGVDPTLASIICGYSARQRPGIFYRSTPGSDFTDIHRAYGRRLLSLAKIADTWKKENENMKNVGSYLQPKMATLRKMFAGLHREVERERRGPQRCPTCLHNKFALYTYLVLTAATGHRPVNSPFERSGDTCDYSGELFLSDKENRSSASATVIALPAIAQEQLRRYRQHLKALRDAFRFRSPEVAEYISRAIAGEAPQLFFIAEDGHESGHSGAPDYQIIPASTLQLETMLRNVWPAPLNWARHKFSSLLAEFDTSFELIDVWMRHDEFGRDALGPHSGLSMHHKREVAATVNKILINELSVKGADGWSHRF